MAAGLLVHMAAPYRGDDAAARFRIASLLVGGTACTRTGFRTGFTAAAVLQAQAVQGLADLFASGSQETDARRLSHHRIVGLFLGV